MMSNLENEVWRPVDGFPYMVSNLGRVKSMARVVNCGPNKIGVKSLPERLVKPFINNQTGYMQVVLPDRKKHSVHRMVACAFFGLPKDGDVVNHKNGIRNDNRLENLEWCSQSYNIKHANKLFGYKNPCEGKFSKNHPVSKRIKITHKNGDVEFFDCALDAVRKYPKFESPSISRCCTGKSKTHWGAKFEFTKEEE